MKSKYSLEQLLELLTESGISCNSLSNIQKRITDSIKIPGVREILDITSPLISDLSDILGVRNPGKVYAIRMDLNEGVDNHKKFVVASLILQGVLTGNLPRAGVNTLIDGGNFNSAKALKFYCERFGTKGIYIVSKLFPEDMSELLRSETFSVIHAPHRYENRIEAEFYEYLTNQMRKEDFRKNKYCLWHAKYGGQVTKWLGYEISKLLPEPPKFLISCLGAGSTLEGIQIPIKEVFRSQIVIPEHEKSQLFAKSGSFPVIFLQNKDSEVSKQKILYRKFVGIPQSILGPHFNEINPLISKKAIKMIDQIMVYQNQDWQNMETSLKYKGLSVGNSSAANLFCAKAIADSGHVVLTIIFEPQRIFYISS